MKRVSVTLTEAQFARLLELRENMAKSSRGSKPSYAAVMREVISWGLLRAEQALAERRRK